jgi:DNA-binding FadR family transcriptional regulator
MAPTLHRGVLERLGPDIISGTYPPGHVLTLERLCADYGVSRTVAREVVQVLASMGLVESRRRTGVTVRPGECWNVFDPSLIRWRLAGPERASQLRQLTELRAAVEPLAAAGAAANAGDTQRKRLVELAARMGASGGRGDLDTFVDQDVEFHRVLLEASGNDMFAGLCDVVEEVLRGRTHHHLMPAHPKPEALRLHEVVAGAVAEGESEVAHAAMTAVVAEVVAEMARLDSSGSDP